MVYTQRCWSDTEELSQHEETADPLMRSLKQGEIGVSFFTGDVARDICKQSDFVLLDRNFQVGDAVKRSFERVHYLTY
jgi:ubiquitin-conjugating enzyme E2 O